MPVQTPDEVDVEILHLSPPCQAVAGAKHDAANTACLKIVASIVKRSRPWAVTFDETAHLLKSKPVYLSLVIQAFTSPHYSVRWQLPQCLDDGVPQKRLRFFIIGSRYVR